MAAGKDIRDVLQEAGIAIDEVVSAALELYVPHPGVETRSKAEEVFRRELDLALSDRTSAA